MVGLAASAGSWEAWVVYVVEEGQASTVVQQWVAVELVRSAAADQAVQ